MARNWPLKVAAVALAVVLWALVRADPSRRSDVFAVTVVPEVTDTRWTLAADPDPGTVQVRFRGPTGDLIRLAREGAQLRVPIDSVPGQDTVVQLRRDWVVLGNATGLVVEDITPPIVRVRLERTLSTLVPIRVLTTGQLPDGMALAAPVGLSPQFARVRGGGTRVRAIDSISILPLDLDDVTASGIYDLELDTAGLGAVSIVPTTASLAIRLEPTLERELMSVPVVALPDSAAALPDSLVIEPPTVRVRLAGARTPVNGTDSAAVRAIVTWEEVSAIAPGQQRRLPIRLRGLPALVRGFAAVDSVTVRRIARNVAGAAAAPGGRR